MAPVDRDEARGQPYLTGPPRRFERVQALKVFREYLRGLRAIHALHPSVMVFGSGHLVEGHPHYTLARETGSRLADAGFTVMTGGGPGLMEASNRGAREAGGVSIACSISLPVEEPPNLYVDQVVKFEHFFIRKEILIKSSCGFVAFPGGLGTFDEVFEAATLIHTGKIQGLPIVLLGRDFWDPLVAFLTTQTHSGRMADCTTSHFYVADSPTDAVNHIRDVAVGHFGLSYARGRRHPPPRRPQSGQS
jgi:uncharacterized protein (TIGR00730 family)